MLETSARLLSLLQTAREWTGAELAERLAVSPRTVRNDVDKLRELGYPVLATRGPAGGYRLGARHSRFSRPRSASRGRRTPVNSTGSP
jgi:predicted DNA-binding transcriptional regulator YafY